MQFTEKFIQSLKPKAKRYDLREKSGNGFGIRISTSGEKSWIFFYTFEGRKRRMTLGTYPSISLSEARSLYRDALKALALGKDPASIKKNKKNEARLSATIDDLIDEYIEKWAKPNKRSWKEDKRILYYDIKTAWGKRKANEITKRDIILMLEKIMERGAPIAANRTLACVRRMFNFAVERDIIQTSPCTAVKAISKENCRDRCLTTEEIKNFWHGLDRPKTMMSSGTKLALKLQLATVQRKGEVVTAEWKEINLDTKWWVIPAHKAKNGHEHRVYLSTLALQLLKEIKKISGGSEWLFPSPRTNKPITGESVAYALRRSKDAFPEVNDFTPHDLRRTGATHMTAMGISRLVVSKILNHVESSVTATYDRHSYDNEKKYALEAWGNKIIQIINETEENNIIRLVIAS